MCDPISIGIIGLATSLGSSGFGLLQASAASAANAESYAETAKLVNEGIVNEYDKLQLRHMSDEETTFKAIEDVQGQLREGRGIAAARAADAGVAGNSVFALMQEMESDAGKAIAYEKRNASLRRIQMELEKKGLHTRTNAQLVGARPAAVQTPDFIGALGQGGSALALGFSRQAQRDAAGSGTRPYSGNQINEGG